MISKIKQRSRTSTFQNSVDDIHTLTKTMPSRADWKMDLDLELSMMNGLVLETGS